MYRRLRNHFIATAVRSTVAHQRCDHLIATSYIVTIHREAALSYIRQGTEAPRGKRISM
jgi:hypothetical protein